MSDVWKSFIAGIFVALIIGGWAVGIIILSHRPSRCERVRDFAIQRVVLDHYTVDEAKKLVPSCEGE